MKQSRQTSRITSQHLFLDKDTFTINKNANTKQETTLRNPETYIASNAHIRLGTFKNESNSLCITVNFDLLYQI